MNQINEEQEELIKKNLLYSETDYCTAVYRKHKVDITSTRVCVSCEQKYRITMFSYGQQAIHPICRCCWATDKDKALEETKIFSKLKHVKRRATFDMLNKLYADCPVITSSGEIKEPNNFYQVKADKTALKVSQYTKEGELIKEFISITDAAFSTGIAHSSICNCCQGKFKLAGGFRWKYTSNKKVAKPLNNNTYEKETGN